MTKRRMPPTAMLRQAQHDKEVETCAIAICFKVDKVSMGF
jgi:hypothetical protein